MNPVKKSSSRWSWSIGQIAGIDIRVHGTFLMLVGWIVLSHFSKAQGTRAAAIAVAEVLAVFAIIVLHELGHALMARRFGIRTRDITLLPIGGVARLERMPEKPAQELMVAIAGPLVNIVLAGLAFGAIVASRTSWSPAAMTASSGPLLAKFLWFNVAIAIFNLLPAFPMDGGRVLRAFLAMQMTRIRATDIAARVGQWMALGFGLLGLMGSPMLVFIAFFVWIGATEEAALVHISRALESVFVKDAMVTEFDTLSSDMTAADATQKIIHTTQDEFPVLHNGSLTGFASRADLLLACGQMAPATVASISRPLIETVRPHEPVERAMQRMQLAHETVLAVLDSEGLVGILLPQNVLQLAGMRDQLLAAKEHALVSP